MRLPTKHNQIPLWPQITHVAFNVVRVTIVERKVCKDGFHFRRKYSPVVIAVHSSHPLSRIPRNQFFMLFSLDSPSLWTSSNPSAGATWPLVSLPVSPRRLACSATVMLFAALISPVWDWANGSAQRACMHRSSCKSKNRLREESWNTSYLSA